MYFPLLRAAALSGLLAVYRRPIGDSSLIIFIGNDIKKTYYLHINFRIVIIRIIDSSNFITYF